MNIILVLNPGSPLLSPGSFLRSIHSLPPPLPITPTRLPLHILILFVWRWDNRLLNATDDVHWAGKAELTQTRFW